MFQNEYVYPPFTWIVTKIDIVKVMHPYICSHGTAIWVFDQVSKL